MTPINPQKHALTRLNPVFNFKLSALEFPVSSILEAETHSAL